MAVNLVILFPFIRRIAKRFTIIIKAKEIADIINTIKIRVHSAN